MSAPDFLLALHQDGRKRLDALAHQIAATCTVANFDSMAGRYRQLKDEVSRLGNILKRRNQSEELPDVDLEDFKDLAEATAEPVVPRRKRVDGPRPRGWGGR